MAIIDSQRAKWVNNKIPNVMVIKIGIKRYALCLWGIGMAVWELSTNTMNHKVAKVLMKMLKN